MFRVFLPLSPGRHTLRAQFSSDDYPLFPSVSEEVTIVVPPPPVAIRLPDTSSWNPVIVYGALALVLLGAGSATFLVPPPEQKGSHSHARKKSPLKRSGSGKRSK